MIGRMPFNLTRQRIDAIPSCTMVALHFLGGIQVYLGQPNVDR
jgi:hypothetical protein